MDLSEIEVGHLVAYWNTTEPGLPQDPVQSRLDVGRVLHKDESTVMVKPYKTVTQKGGLPPRFLESKRTQLRQLELVRRMETKGIVYFGFELSHEGLLDAESNALFSNLGLFTCVAQEQPKHCVLPPRFRHQAEVGL